MPWGGIVVSEGLMGFVTPEEHVAWPFYIVCDVSESMHRKLDGTQNELTPYEAMRESLLALVDFTIDHVEAADIAHLGVVAFADDTEIIRELRKLNDEPEVKPLPKGTYTNYEKVFTKLSDVVAADIERLESRQLRVKRPVVFFITDGYPEVDGQPQPRESWQEPLHRLQALTASRTGGSGVRIAMVALGFEGTNCGYLRLIAQSPGIACIAEAGVASTHELMSSLLTSILNSVTLSVAEGDLVFIPPRGMRLCR
jgi:uncharacterized protein YegL